MKQAIFASVRYVFAGAFLTVAWASASTVPVCQPGSLASYVALGAAGCTAGGSSFFDFSAPTPQVVGNPPVANPSQIMIAPVVGGQSVGVSFSAMSNGTNFFSIPNPTQNDSVSYYINYSIDPPILTTGGLSLDPPFGNVVVTQRYCVADLFANNCASGTLLQISVTPASPTAVVTFPNPASLVDVLTEITLKASPGNPSGFESVTSMVTSAVPEPSVSLLAGFGLSVLAFVGYKRRTVRASHSG